MTDRDDIVVLPIGGRGVHIVGILNVTPDSFSDGGQIADLHCAVRRAVALGDLGADVIDIGGESTRPGARPVDPAVEIVRVLDSVRQVAALGIPVSIDTMHADTARAAVAAGARIVNDVSGGKADADMFATVAELGCQYVLGHLRGEPATMHLYASYGNVVAEVVDELATRVDQAKAAGVSAAQIVLDPGIGFAKSATHSWEVLRGLDRIAALGHPLMVGVSRKRFLAGLIPPSRDSWPDRDTATAVLSALLAGTGVAAVRVHDVAATRIALSARDCLSGGKAQEGSGQLDRGTTPDRLGLNAVERRSAEPRA